MDRAPKSPRESRTPAAERAPSRAAGPALIDRSADGQRRADLKRTIEGAAERARDARAAANRTGLPDRLKAGIETLSGVSMDAVRVHRGSALPAQVGALAFAKGTDIHLAPGHDAHLPHEAWHVVQQAQNRVRPTMQLMGGVAVNADPALEREADIMGARSLHAGGAGGGAVMARGGQTIQRTPIGAGGHGYTASNPSATFRRHHMGTDLPTARAATLARAANGRGTINTVVMVDAAALNALVLAAEWNDTRQLSGPVYRVTVSVAHRVITAAHGANGAIISSNSNGDQVDGDVALKVRFDTAARRFSITGIAG